MAFPQTAAPTTFASAGGVGTTAHLVPMASTVNAGDLLIMMVATISTGTLTTPTGWTLPTNGNTSGANGAEQNIYYKIAAGTEGGTNVDVVTSQALQMAVHCYRITGWHGTTPPELGTGTAPTTPNPDPPSLTPSWGAADTLWIPVLTIWFNGNRTISAYPTNYTNGTYTEATSTQAAAVATCRRELNAASENPGTYTVSTNIDATVNTIAIRPAVPTMTGTVAVTQAVQVFAGSGTNTAPVVPPAASGNRMGGTGAVRKPPR